jgi:hypothetical protein
VARQRPDVQAEPVQHRAQDLGRHAKQLYLS